MSIDCQRCARRGEMSLRHALLGLLDDDQPASGYELLKVFDSSLANAWPATQSQVYSELNRLADEGLITVSALGPRGRKDYAITVDGSGRCATGWPLPGGSPCVPTCCCACSSSIRYPSTRPGSSSPHAASESGRAGAAARDRRGHLRQRRPHLYRWADRIEFGLRKAQMELEWAEWAIDQLNASAVVWRR